MGKNQIRPPTSASVKTDADHPDAASGMTSNDLHDSTEIYRTLFETANDAILIADTETGIIMVANARAAELFDRDCSEIIGMHQSQLHPQDQEGFYRALFNQQVDKLRGIAGEAEILTRRGRHIPVEISANVVRLKGRKLIVGIFRDITQRQKTARALRIQNAYMLSLHDTPSDLCAG